MGEAQGTLFEPEFNRSIKVQTFSQKLTSHAGAVLLRERIHALAMGSENQDDLDRLAHDRAMRMAVWDRPGEEVLQQRLASQSTQSRLIDWLAFSPNRETLRHSLFDWTHRHLRSTGRQGDHAVMRATIDVDSFPIQIHGHQQGSPSNKRTWVTATIAIPFTIR